VDTPFPGQPPIVACILVDKFPFTCALLPPTLKFPFAPMSPLLFVRLLGGLTPGVCVDELKLPVLALPATLSAPQPVPVANKPPGGAGGGVCAISCWINLRPPLAVVASDVTMYTGKVSGTMRLRPAREPRRFRSSTPGS